MAVIPESRKKFDDNMADEDPANFDWDGLMEVDRVPDVGPQFSMMVKLAYLENVSALRDSFKIESGDGALQSGHAAHRRDLLHRL